jgi:predicted RNase H-like HicB family nuclease
MTDSARYMRIVEWSDEDGLFVGQCPGVVGPCCHGPDETEVYRELCEVVDEWIAQLYKERRPLPPAAELQRR